MFKDTHVFVNTVGGKKYIVYISQELSSHGMHEIIISDFLVFCFYLSNYKILRIILFSKNHSNTNTTSPSSNRCTMDNQCMEIYPSEIIHCPKS